MNYHPITFVEACMPGVLDGSKTQTRRVVKTQPRGEIKWASGETIDGRRYRGWVDTNSDGAFRMAVRCPYGAPGDRLWVRERYVLYDDSTKAFDRDAVWYDRANPVGRHFRLCADGSHKLLRTCPRLDPADRAEGPASVLWWHAPGRMPRWASRITLELTDVRVQRVQDISEEDAKAEGCPERTASYKACDHPPFGSIPPTWKNTFRLLWDSINGGRTMLFEYEDDRGVVHKERVPANYGWDANPWVWALTFKKVEGEA